MKKFEFPYTERQLQMVTHPARILSIAAGTKTGKSYGLFCWLCDGLLNGQSCCFTAPWFFRARAAFDAIKLLLASHIKRRQVRVNEARLQFVALGGGFLDFQSADNPNAAFGSNYDRVVIDEASRCPREIYPAALTTISATNGKLRLAFNCELSSKNWALANFLRVQRMSPEERAATSEDCLTFPTGGDGLVDAATIEMMKAQMPRQLFESLYLGVIHDSDSSLFKNLDRIFSGVELDAPAPGEQYFMGVDLARKTDFTVATVVDALGRVVQMDRFTQTSWSLQVARVAALYRTFNCTKVVCDATGVGDAIVEQLEEAGLNVEAFVFTLPSRRQLIEELVLVCDGREISIPASDRWKVFRSELEAMEYVLDGSTIRYSVPSSLHDDCIFSLALAVHAFRSSRGLVLGLIDYLKRAAREVVEGIRRPSGELVDEPLPRLPSPVVVPKPVTVNNFEVWLVTHRAPACEACHATCTTYDAERKVRCAQCGAIDGALPEPVGQCCAAYLPQVVAGGIRCGSCGHQRSNHPAVIGMSRRDYARNRFSALDCITVSAPSI